MELRINRTLLALVGISAALCLLLTFCALSGTGYLVLRPLPTPTMSFVESVRATATAEALDAATRPTATNTASPTPQPTAADTAIPTLEPTAAATPQPTMEPEATPTTGPAAPPAPTSTPRPAPTNTPKPPPSTTLIRGPYLQWVRPHSIIVAWETSSEVDSVVEYGTTQAYGSTASDYGWTTRHAVTLTGLNPYTTYHYRVKTSAQALSDDRTFKSAAGPGQSHFTFVVTGDTNSGIDPTHFERYRKSADEGHPLSVAIIRTLNPDFYLHTGDLTYVGSDMAAWDDFFSFEGDLMSKITMFPTPGDGDGNHYNYFNLFYLPNNERWYSFDYGNAHFISLQIDGYVDVSAGSEQYRWLENDLASTDKTWKFAFFHFPPYSYGPEGPKPEARAVHPLFMQYGVDMVFSANDRNYQRYEVDGITYLVTGGGGGETGRLTGGGDVVPIFMERTKHVMKITVAGNTVHSVAYRLDAEGSEMDPFTLTAD